MFDKSFSSIFSENKNRYLIVEDSEGILDHLTHLEELILTRKKEGLDVALTFIKELLNTFQGHSSGKISATVKFDGSPAIITGYNPENGRFFVSTKSLGNKIPKVNYNDTDIDLNHHEAGPGLTEKLKKALEYLPHVIKSGIYQGDFMFDHESIKDLNFDGTNYISFKPNTITYAVPKDSPEGEDIKKAKIGVVLHTEYTGPTLSQLTKKFGVNVSAFPKSEDVWLKDAIFRDFTGTVTLTEEETASIKDYITAIESIKNITKWNAIHDDNYKFLNVYINTLIRNHEFITDPEKSFTDFINWYNQRVVKEIDKLKTVSGKEKKRAALHAMLDNINANSMTYINIFNLTKKIEQVKMFFVRRYNFAVKTKQFITDEKGNLKLTDPEGYVAIDHIGNAIKLINRLEFSHANLSKTREEKFK